MEKLYKDKVNLNKYRKHEDNQHILSSQENACFNMVILMHGF